MNSLILIVLLVFFLLFLFLDYSSLDLECYFQERRLADGIKKFFAGKFALKPNDKFFFCLLVGGCVFLVVYDMYRFSLQRDEFSDYYFKDGSYLRWAIFVSVVQLARAVFGELDSDFKENTVKYKLIAECAGLAGFVAVLFALTFNVDAFMKVNSKAFSQPFGNDLVNVYCQRSAVIKSEKNNKGVNASDITELHDCTLSIKNTSEDNYALIESGIKVILSIFTCFFVQLAVDLKIRLARVDYEKVKNLKKTTATS